MKIKTNKLSGPALDWAVASYIESLDCFPKEGGGFEIQYTQHDDFLEVGSEYSPSTNWSQGGPIMEDSMIVLWHAGRYGWASFCQQNPHCEYVDSHAQDEITGPTPLIAACRAIVAAKLGDEIDVPGDLITNAPVGHAIEDSVFDGKNHRVKVLLKQRKR